MEGISAMNLWNTIIDFLHPQGGGDFKLVHQTQILKHHESSGDIYSVFPKARLFSMRTALHMFEDNEAVKKQINPGSKHSSVQSSSHKKKETDGHN